MTTYLPKRGEQVWLPAGPLVVRMQGGVNADDYRLDAVTAEGAPPLLHRPRTMILPRVTAPTVVRIVDAPGRESVGPHSVVTLVVGPDGVNSEADRLQLVVDVSGLHQLDVLELAPSGGRVRATILGRLEDKPLPAHAEFARNVARSLLRVEQLPADEAVDLVVAVDASPSMAVYVEDGSLEAALELVAGVASVVDPNRVVEAVMINPDPHPLGGYAIEELAARTLAAVRAAHAATGCRGRQCVAPVGQRTITYLVSDAVPSDVRPLEQRSVHTIALADSSFSRTGGRALLGDPDTLVPVAGGRSRVGADVQPRWERHVLTSIVESLLTPYRTLRNPS